MGTHHLLQHPGQRTGVASDISYNHPRVQYVPVFGLLLAGGFASVVAAILGNQRALSASQAQDQAVQAEEGHVREGVTQCERVAGRYVVQDLPSIVSTELKDHCLELQRTTQFSRGLSASVGQ